MGDLINSSTAGKNMTGMLGSALVILVALHDEFGGINKTCPSLLTSLPVASVVEYKRCVGLELEFCRTTVCSSSYQNYMSVSYFINFCAYFDQIFCIWT